LERPISFKLPGKKSAKKAAVPKGAKRLRKQAIKKAAKKKVQKDNPR
jgi:hypothetical protein